VETDRESRSECDSSDWLLDRSVFRNLSCVWPSDIDLFSSHWNAQLPSFVSWRPQPGASAVNAFSLNWSNHSGYAFPPFSLIPKCLEKLRREKANLVLICPVWPAQPWFPILLELACDVPLLLHSSHNLLVSATGWPIHCFTPAPSSKPRGSYPARFPKGGIFGIFGLPTFGRKPCLNTLDI
jgi:hypothetical protein